MQTTTWKLSSTDPLISAGVKVGLPRRMLDMRTAIAMIGALILPLTR
jgi:hypothetical protein